MTKSTKSTKGRRRRRRRRKRKRERRRRRRRRARKTKKKKMSIKRLSRFSRRQNVETIFKKMQNDLILKNVAIFILTLQKMPISRLGLDKRRRRRRIPQ